MHFLRPSRGNIKMSGTTLFCFYKSRKNTHIFSGSIVIVMGNSFKCELAGVGNLFRTPALRL